MRVGLTYDLRDHYLAAGYGVEETAEFDSIATIEGIEGALGHYGLSADRIGTVQQLAARLAAGERWDFVFNIAEGLHGIGREAQVPALLDAYGVPYCFSDPLVMALTLHKGMTKHVVRDKGVPTAPFVVIEEMADIAAIDLPFPLFTKPVAEGTGKGVLPTSRVTSIAALRKVCRQLLARYRQPVLVETFLPGREFTIGITGTGTAAAPVATMEVVLTAEAEAGVYSYVNKEECDQRVRYHLADDPEAQEAARVALAAWRALGCRDGGRIDIRSDAMGRPHFLEVNPLAGLHPQHSDLPIMCRLAGIPYEALIGRILDSAFRRCGLRLGAASGVPVAAE
ncbi:D-alanine--D-alanine ligase [Rhodospirillaceae bacterium SYSU D60014]|uniref:D-alanine--D-alanine ligase family protein n=1 Tax=Virgifigura deserti TaxID=2268457 RepID=UPI000E6659C4